VRKQWGATERSEGRDQELLRVKNSLWETVREASERKVTVCTGKDEETGERIYEVVDQPDIKGKTAALLGIAKMLGGLDAPQSPGDPSALPANAGITLTDGSTLAEPVAVDAADATAELRRRRAAGK
jgi:hypothetical protein